MPCAAAVIKAVFPLKSTILHSPCARIEPCGRLPQSGSLGLWRLTTTIADSNSQVAGPLYQ
jgi:hypothetical protein